MHREEPRNDTRAIRLSSARSVDEVIALLGQHREEVRVVAGGRSLIPMMKLRLARRAHLSDLQDLDELRGIHSEPDAVVIAAMMPQPRWPAARSEPRPR